MFERRGEHLLRPKTGVAVPIDVDLERPGCAVIGTDEQTDHVPAVNRREFVAVVVDRESDREDEVPGGAS
jgi:hypothetical protein